MAEFDLELSMKRLSLFVIALALVACTEDDPDPGNTDTSTAADTASMSDTSTTADTGAMTDTGTLTDTASADISTDTSSGACTIENFGLSFELAEYYSAEEYFLYSGDNGDTAPFDTLYLEIYGASTLGPVDFTFTGENYDACSTCLTIEANCTDGTCTQTFLVREGTLSISAAATTQDAPFQATLSNLVLDQVTIDSETSTSTPVAGGDVWCIDQIDIDTTIDVISP